MSSSLGPIDKGHPRYGECRYCWEENHTRDTGFYFEPRQRMVGPVCGHRLHPPKRVTKAHAYNSLNAQLRVGKGYWYRRACLPDYCGEFGELSDPRLAGMSKWEDEQVERALAGKEPSRD